MRLGNDEIDIYNKFVKKINDADMLGLIKENNNQVRSIIDGYEVEIKVFIEKGKVQSINAYLGISNRDLGNIIYVK